MKTNLKSVNDHYWSLSNLSKVCRQPSVLGIFASLSLNTIFYLASGSPILFQNPKQILSHLPIHLISETLILSAKQETKMGIANQNLLSAFLGDNGQTNETNTHQLIIDFDGSNRDDSLNYDKALSSKLLLSNSVPIASDFGWRTDPISGKVNFHSGVDFGTYEGTPVLAFDAGQVAIADWYGGYGLAVILEHDRGTRETIYTHFSEVLVNSGEMVKPGQTIGRVGSTGYSTGPHLHFEQRKLTDEGWIAVNPLSIIGDKIIASTSDKESTASEALMTEFNQNFSLDSGETSQANDIIPTKISQIKVQSIKTEELVNQTPEFEAWVTELKQEFTNLKTKTLSSSNGYPEIACTKKLEGTVVIGAFVNAWGQMIREPKVLQTSQHEILDREAVNYLKNLRLPETGEPTAYQYVFQFNYDPNNCPSGSNPNSMASNHQ